MLRSGLRRVGSMILWDPPPPQQQHGQQTTEAESISRGSATSPSRFRLCPTLRLPVAHAPPERPQRQEAASTASGASRLTRGSIGVLGEGGFGTVWKAQDIRTVELVAIKSGTKKGDGAALLREAALLTACLGNPAVVGFGEVVHGPGADDVHIVMDLPGGSLRHLLDTRRRGPRFTESETRDAMRQLLAGVDTMGRQGIVHGDLKPENVLLSKSDGRLIICDFGLAISVAEPPCHIEGTLWYSAPEQLLGEKNCGLVVDAWALGCVMAELLTGKPLVEGYHPTQQLIQTIFLLGVPDEMMQMDNGMDASTPSELRDRVPEELLTPAGFDVLNGLLQYNPQDRLTPAAALQMPWFAEEDASVRSVAAMATPRRHECE